MPVFLFLLMMGTAFASEMVIFTSLIIDEYTDEANSEIFLMDMKEKKTTRLTNNKFMDYTPALHPSGKLAAYVTDRWKYDVWGDEQIVLKDLITGKEERLDVGQRKWTLKPGFSHDGKYLYFSMARTPFGESPMSSYKIYRYDIQEKKVEQITAYDHGNFFDVSPSPDGKTLAYRFAADGQQYVKLLDLLTLESKPLTPARPDNLPEEMPAWRSAEEVTVVAHYGEHEDLQRSFFSVPLQGRPATQILQSPLVYDYHSACWFNQESGVIAAAESETGTVQLFHVQGEKLTKISSSEYWWSSEPDCKTIR